MDQLPQLDRDALFTAAADGATVITPNARAARHLRQLFDARQQQLGRTAWPSPEILPWSAWLESLWQEYVLLPQRRAGMRLNELQEQTLWERIVAASPQGRELIAITGAAALARDAWGLLHEYRVADLTSLDDTEHGATFHSWAAGFSRMCDEHAWIDAARLTARLQCAIARHELAAPDRVIFAAFDKFTPQQQNFIAVLQTAGATCELAMDGHERAPRISCIALNDSAAEVQRAAEWARARLEADPSARIAVVVPDLNRLRDAVERVFAEVLAPDSLLSPASRPVFELSLGRPLSAHPMIHAALELLRWIAGAQPITAAGALVRSPFLRAATAEAGPRALLDAEMRRRCGPEVSLSEVHRLARISCPELASLLTAAGRAVDRAPRPASAWCKILSSALSAAGWPGERPLDSIEYQTFQAWFELLRRFGTLEATHPVMSFPDAVACLARFATQQIFQPRNIGAPVQVLGFLEASGSQFDHLWVTGLDDDTWPPRGQPNPFLPLALQKRYSMPHASPADDLAFAQVVMVRLVRSAREVVFSYPEVDGERPLRPSPLLAPLPQRGLVDILPHAPTAWIAQIHACRDQLQPSDAPGTVAVCGDNVRGGTHIFQLQAACPFRAFAELRLGAEPLEEPVAGLDARQRGTLVHRVLEYVWQELRSYAELAALTPSNQQRLVASCVERALADFPPLQRDQWSGRFAHIERERLVSLISEWLELEKQRQPFEVIGREESQEVSIGGVRVRIRVDRVDRLADGRKVIIDYKTGRPKPLADCWGGDRPDEPQLPLYAITVPGDIAALAFAHLQTGKLKFNGAADDPDILPRVAVPDDGPLAARIGDWRAVLNRLGEAFRNGEAAVDPKDPDQTCRYCAQKPLCRIYESSLAAAMESSEPAENADAE